MLDELSEVDLIEDLGRFAYDPLGFVMWAFPWGEEGTELANESGPNNWQRKQLIDIGLGIIRPDEPVLMATTSGHGVGKSALVSWLTWWAFSTFEGTRGVVTANTENQLKTKTWVEISKWHRLFIAKHLFKCTATAIFSTDKETAREWRIDIVPWSERNTEAFAGLHNSGKRILILFDEASAIPEIIWETTEGALTDKNTEIIWGVYGNPTKNDTRFRDCFEGGKFAHRWNNQKVDSRDVPFTNKEQIQKWIDDYGLDSDFIRIRVLGEFPKNNGDGFISPELVAEALIRELEEEPNPQTDPWVLGVDVARFGEDNSVLYPRRGLDARSFAPLAFQGLSTTALVANIIELDRHQPFDMIYIDTGGVGAGVYDQLRDKGYPVYEVRFGAKPVGVERTESWMNVRSEIWGAMRDFLGEGIIGNKTQFSDSKLDDELTAPSYYVSDNDKTVLESKKSMRARKVASPDAADALATTFAFPATVGRSLQLDFEINEAPSTYDPYAQENLR